MLHQIKKKTRSTNVHTFYTVFREYQTKVWTNQIKADCFRMQIYLNDFFFPGDFMSSMNLISITMMLYSSFLSSVDTVNVRQIT